MPRARNPAWTFDELILALDLYLRVPRSPASKRDPAVAELSEVLRALPFHDDREENFRNINSVWMKLQNFKTVDPDYTGTGLPAGAGARERRVWARFASNREELRLAAAAIREEAVSASPTDLIPPAEEDPEASIVEGRLLFVRHYRRERKGSRKKKLAVLRETGRLVCEVCGFDFEPTYGPLGREFAECHHRLPLTAGVRRTALSDLAIVCANCHRMIHRRSPPVEVKELQALIAERRPPASEDS